MDIVNNMKKQNYKESKLILSEIKKANRILINCHRGPDPDSIGSALALKYVLRNMDKVVSVICPSDKLYEEVSYLPDFNLIKKEANFSGFNYSEFDIFITLDSSSWDMVTGNKTTKFPKIPIYVIDHHHTNTLYGSINLVDKVISSVGELLYLVFEDWNVKIDKNTATALLSGIIGDTGIFKYPNTSKQTFVIASKLVDLGAEKNKIIENIYRNFSYNLIKLWGEALSNLKIDEKHRFVYSAIPFEIFEQYGKPDNAKETSADLFAQITKGTEFGFMALEREKNKLSVSFRARNDFDTSRLAVELGGGGHPAASGAGIEGMPYDKALEKVLQVARKYANKSQ